MLGKLKFRVKEFFSLELYRPKTQKILQAYLTDLGVSYTLWCSVITGAAFWMTKHVRCTIDKYVINMLMIIILLIA